MYIQIHTYIGIGRRAQANILTNMYRYILARSIAKDSQADINIQVQLCRRSYIGSGILVDSLVDMHW